MREAPVVIVGQTEVLFCNPMNCLVLVLPLNILLSITTFLEIFVNFVMLIHTVCNSSNFLLGYSTVLSRNESAQICLCTLSSRR